MPEQPYIIFEEGDERNRERWFVVESKAKAIEELIHGYGYATNVLPIDQETYNEHKKLEEIISSAEMQMYTLEKTLHDAMFNDFSFFDDPEYIEARKFDKMWREAHRMNRQFDCKHEWDHRYYETTIDECRECWLTKPCDDRHIDSGECDALAEWEKELLAAPTNKENK